jgi:exopolysaccharide biosynthesis WecB/TagA/CpsF family protein
MTGALDAQHGQRLNAFDLVAPDGQPVRWALRWLHGERLRDRVAGPDLTTRLCRRLAENGLSVFFFGSSADVLEAIRSRLEQDLPALRIAGMEPSSFRQLSVEENIALMERIRASGADVVLVGLGCPRQEVFVYENAPALSRPVLAVGAAFNFLAGDVARAPLWMQGAGLEWLYRLAREPRRLWRRYLVLNPIYLSMVALQLLGVKRDLTATARPPLDMMRYG